MTHFKPILVREKYRKKVERHIGELEAGSVDEERRQ
jgi:hypothetical protein